MKAYGNTDIGNSRNTNQDYFYVSAEPVGNLPNLFIVADGMGGHKAGDVASREAVKIITEYIETSDKKDPVLLMENAIDKANEGLIKEAENNPELKGMGTTIVMATMWDDILYIANIGDSRLYVIGQEIRQITRDHSFVEAMVSMGKLDRKSAKNHARKNVLTRALGVEKGTVADFFEIKNEAGNRILMCSDGLTNMVDDQEIKSIVMGQEHIDEAVNKLIEKANKNGGADNITSILIEP